MNSNFQFPMTKTNSFEIFGYLVIGIYLVLGSWDLVLSRESFLLGL